MANFTQVLKDEITRISRKEIKASTESMRKTTISLKKTVAELKLKISGLEKLNKKLSAAVSQENLETTEGEAASSGTARVTAKQIKALRSRFGLSQGDFGKLIGVTGQSVLAMEHKDGKFTLRSANLAKYLKVKEMKKQEALEMLGKLI